MIGHIKNFIHRKKEAVVEKIPLPYTPYKYDFEKMSFEQYRNMVYRWVEGNTKYIADNDVKDFVASTLDLVPEYYHPEIEWLLTHLDKVRVMSDFSGLAFGIQIDEEGERFGINYPSPFSSKLSLFEGYNPEEFSNLSMIGKMEWMYKHCEFIPFRIINENYFDYTKSHKYSHWKRDAGTMSRLKEFLANSTYPPSDRVFYFVKFSKERGWYLQRDFEKSPKPRD